MLEIDLQLAKVGFCLILIIRHIQGRAEQGGVAGGVTPPTSLKFGYLTKCVGKISEPNIVGKFGVFYAKKNEIQDFINIQSCRNQNFTGDDGF